MADSDPGNQKETGHDPEHRNHPAASGQMDSNALDAWFDQRFDEKMAERESAHQPAMTIIATKGTLDMAYPPFILASTAAALGWEVSVFFTFYGLSLLKKDLDLKVTPARQSGHAPVAARGPGMDEGQGDAGAHLADGPDARLRVHGQSA